MKMWLCILAENRITQRGARALPQLKLGRIGKFWGIFLALSRAALSNKQASLACCGLS
jgi:hypothetical protein